MNIRLFILVLTNHCIFIEILIPLSQKKYIYIGKLSVAGTVPPIDVYRAFVYCHNYKLAILNCLFKRRFDYHAVKAALKQLIAVEIEVIPRNFVVK